MQNAPIVQDKDLIGARARDEGDIGTELTAIWNERDTRIIARLRLLQVAGANSRRYKQEGAE